MTAETLADAVPGENGLVMVMRMEKRERQDGTTVLVCVAHGQGQAWEAFCLDFDLAVQGTSLAEVRSGLEDAIGDYVAAAETEAEPARSQLLDRRTPFFVRAGWGLRFFWTAIAGRNNSSDAVVGFPVSCPA